MSKRPSFLLLSTPPKKARTDYDDFKMELENIEAGKFECNSFDFASKSIGHGQFGEVFMVKHKETNDIFAVKEISYSDDRRKQILCELKFMLEHKHENLIPMNGYYIADRKLGIVMSLMKGSFEKFGEIKEEVLPKVANSVLNGLNFIHEKELIHNDIKRENIFLSNSNVVMLGDFGNLESFTSEKIILGTYHDPNTANYTGKEKIKRDMWAFGCTMIELVNGKRPLFAKDVIPHVEIPENLGTKDLKDFVSLCYNADHENGIQLLQKSTFLTQNSDQKMFYAWAEAITPKSW
uniref:mitogen-activated protein kinase kinase n=1 Tax=Panagrolaimus davidi TaxID=227884 RepID=A0A914QSW2_9BILA